MNYREAVICISSKAEGSLYMLFTVGGKKKEYCK